MESPARSKAVLELGKSLVVQLGLGDDPLAQWMAHDIAARIDAVERAGPAAPISTRDECAKSIFLLWDHRNKLPSHLQVFRELEPLLRTLSSLDLDNGDDYRYFRQVLREAALDGTVAETKEWLELAFGLDYAARLLIQYALRTAGITAASKAKPWVDAALSAGVDAIEEQHVVEFVLDDVRGNDDTGIQIADLQDKIDKLNSFAALATDLVTSLQNQIKHVQSVSNGSFRCSNDSPE